MQVFLARTIQGIILRRYSVTILGIQVLIREYLIVVKDIFLSRINSHRETSIIHVQVYVTFT